MAIVIVVFVIRSKVVLTIGDSRSNQIVERKPPQVLVIKDDDGYGLQITARGYEEVRKVEMVVSYNYKGKPNPPLLASGAPLANSYWAHFRFENCSRGDCLYYKIDEAEFRLTLTYDDGETADYSKVIHLPQISASQTALDLERN